MTLSNNNKVTIITVTLDRPSLMEACKSVDAQTFSNWHHIILGDGISPHNYTASENRSVLGFSYALGATEPGANMLNGTPNPLLRWALKNLRLGDYVCFLDDDNQYTPRYLEKMTAALESHPNAGIVLCGAEDLRYGQNIDGYPILGHCDNSAFMARSYVAQSIEFPHASLEKDVVQDYEFIKLCSEKYSFTRVDEKLLLFGTGMNPPPERGQVLFLESWKLAQQASYLAYDGQYELAECVFKQAISQFKDDAWSWKKLAELYLITHQKAKAEEAFDEWYKLYLRVDPDHCASQFAYAQYLKHRGYPYDNILASSIEKRRLLEEKEPDFHEHTIYTLLSYIFMEDESMSKYYLDKCRMFDPEPIGWAFLDAAWTIKAYKEDILALNLKEYEDFFGR